MKTILTLLILCVSLSANAQDYEKIVFPKDPVSATLFSLVIPGGGHLYAGDLDTGFALLGSAVVAPLAGWLLYVNSAIKAEDVSHKEANTTPLVLGSLVSLACWVGGAIDASNAAHKYNENISLSPSVSQVEGGQLLRSFIVH
ncbi:MAG: hypothetical protein WD267_10175 [Balneolales bacterium]